MLWFFSAILLLGCIGLVWAAWIEPRWFRLARHEVQLHGLRHPLKAVLIGDLQPNIYHWPISRLTRVLQDTQVREAPDLVFWLGDYYNGHTGASGQFLDKRPRLRDAVERRLPPMEHIAPAMSALSGRLGSFAVLGNHDWAWSGEETRAALENVGISVLCDDVADVRDGESGQHLQIAGYDDISSDRRPNYDAVHSKLDPDAAQIGLAHSPDTFDKALGGPALMLSGHTHGGQVRLPLIGAVILPITNRRYDRGWFSERHRRLFVTTGLGTSLPPMRFMCRPEIVVLDLVPIPGETKS